MKESYQAAHNRSLYEDGKAVEAAHHIPAREAAKAALSKEDRPQQAPSRVWS